MAQWPGRELNMPALAGLRNAYSDAKKQSCRHAPRLVEALTRTWGNQVQANPGSAQ